MSSSNRQHPPLANINQFSPMRPSDINDASRPPAPEKGTRLRPEENVAPCPLPTDAHTATPAPSPSASPSVPSSNPTPSFPFVPDSTSSSRCTCRDVPPSPSFVKRFEEVLRRFEELYPGEKLDDATTSDQCKDSCIRCALERAKNNSSLQTPQIPSENTNPPKNTNNPMSVSETADTCGVSQVEGALTVPSPEKKSDSVPTSPTPLEEPKPSTHPLFKDDPSTLPSRESDPRIDTNLTPVKPDPPPLPHAACPHSERTNRLPTSDKTMSPLPPSIFDNPASSLPPSIFYNPASSLPPSIPDNRAVSPLPPIPANPPPSLRSSLSDNATPLLTYRKNNTRGPSFAEHLECLLKKLYSVSPRPGEKDSDTTFPPGNANPSPVKSAASSRLDSTTCLPKSDNTAPSLHASIPGTTAPIRASISIPSLSSSIPGTTPSLPSSIPSSTHSICSCKDITRDQSFEEQLDVSIKRSSTIYPHSEVKGIHSSTSDSSEKSFFWPGLKLLTPQVCPHRDDTSSSPGLTSPKTIHPEDTNTSGPLSDLPPPSGHNTSSVCIIHPSGKTDTSSAPALDSSRLPNTSLETASRAPLFDLYPYLTVEPSFFPIASSDSSGATCSVTHLVDGTPSLPASLDTDGTPSASLKPHMLQKSTSTSLFDLYPSLAVDPSFFPIASSDSSSATCSVPSLVDGTPSLPASLDTDGTPSASLKPHMLQKSTSTSLFDLYPPLAVDPSFFPIASSDSSSATCSVPPLVDGTPSLPASLDTDGTPSASLKPHMLQKSTSTSLFDLYPSLAVDPSFFPTISSVPSVATCSVSPLVDGTPSLPASLDTDGTPSSSLKPHMLQKSTSTSLFDLYPSLAVDPSFFPTISSVPSVATCSVSPLVDGTPSLTASLDTDGTPSSSLKPHMLQKSTSTSLFDLYPSLAVDPSFFPITSSDSSVATCSVPPLVDGTPSLPASLDTDGTPSASLKPHMLQKSTSTSLFDLYPSLAVDPSFFPITSSDSRVATCSVSPLVDGTPSLPASLDTDGTPSASLKPHLLEKSTSTSLFDLYPSLAVDPSFFPIASSDSSGATCSVPSLVDGTSSLPASLDTDGTPSASLKPHMLQKSTSTHLLDLYSSLAVDPSFFPIASSDLNFATCSVPSLVNGTSSLPASLDTDGTPSASLKPHMLQKTTSTHLLDLYSSLAVDPSFFPIGSSDSSSATCSVPSLVDGTSSLPASLDTDGTPSASLKPHMLQKSTSTHLLDLYSSLAVDPSFVPTVSSDSRVATCSVPPLVDGTPSLPASLDTDGTPSASLKPHMLEKSTSTSLFDLYSSLALDPSFFPIASSDSSSATCSVPPLVDGTPSLPASLDTDGTPSASLKPHMLQKSTSTSLFDLYPSLAVDPSFFPTISSVPSVATCSVSPLVDGTPSLPASLDTDGTPSSSLKPHMLQKSTSTSLFDLYPSLAVDPSFFPITSSDSSVATCSVSPLVDGTPSLPASLDTDGTPSSSLKPHMLQKSTSTSLFDLYSSLAVDPSFFPIGSSDSSSATCSVPSLVDGTSSLPASLDTDGTPSASLKPHMLQKSTSTHLLDLYSSLAVDPSFVPTVSSDSRVATCSVPPLVDGTPSLPASLDTDGTPSASLKPHMLEKSTSTSLFDLYSSLALDPSFFPIASSDSSSATCSVPPLVDGTPSLPASLDTDGTPSASLKPHMLQKSTSTSLFDLYPSLAVDPSFFPTISSVPSVATCSVSPLVDGTPSLPASLDTDGTPSSSLKPHMLQKSTSTSLFDLYSSLAVDPSFFPIGSSDSSSATCSVPSLVDGTSSLPASLDTDGTPSASLKPHMLQKSTSTHLLDLYSSLAVDPSFVPTVSSDSRVATCSVPPLVDGTPSLPASLDTDGTPSASLKPHMLEKSTSTSLFDLYSSLALDPSFFPIASSDSRGPTCSDPPLVDGTPTLPESMGTDVAPSASLKPNVLETGSHFHPSENIDSSEYRHICPHRLKYLHVWRPPSRRPAPHLHEWSTFIVVVPVSDTDIPNLWVPAPSVTDRLASPSEDASVCFLTITDSSVPPLLDVTIPAPLGVDGNLFDHHRGISDTFSTPVVDTNVSPCTTSYIDLTTPAPAATDIYAHSSKIIALAPVPSRTTTPIVDSSASASLFRKDASSSPPSVYTDVARPPEATTPIAESSASSSPPSVSTDFYRPPEVTTPIVESCASTSRLSVDTDFYRPPEVTTPIVESSAFTSRLSVDTDFYRPPEVTTPIVESCASTSRLSVDTDFYRPPEVTSPIVESSASSSPPSVYTDFARPPEATTPIVESGASSSPPSVYTDFAPPPEATTPIVESGASSSPLSVDTDCTLLSGSTLQESGFLLPSTMDMNPSVPHLEKVHSCAAPSIEYKNICFPLKKYQHLWSTLEGIPTSLLSQRIADMSLPGCTDHSAPPFMSPDLPPQLLGKSESVLVPSGMPDYSSSTTEKAYVSISQQHDLPVLLSEETSLPISGTETTKPSIPRPETIEVLMSRLDKAVSSFSTTEKTNLPPFFQEETSHSISGEEKTDFPVSTEKMDPSAHPSENSVLSMPTLKKMDSPACFLETEKCDASPSAPVKETLFVKVDLGLSATEKIDLSISSPVKSDLSLSCPVKSNLIVISSVKTEVSVETGIPVVSPENKKLAVELPVESGAQDVSPVKTDLFAPFLMETDVQDVSPVATDDLVVSPGGKMLSFGSALESDAQDISPVKTDLSDTSLLQSNTQDVSPVKTKLSINSPVKTDIQDVFPEKSDLPVASPMAPDVPVVSPEKNNISVAFVEESDIHDDLSVVPSGKNDIQAVNQVNRSVTFDTDILTLSYERDSEARAPCSSCGHSQPVVSCGNISPSVPSLWDDDESCESSQRNLNSSICPNYACTCAASPSDLVPSVFMPGNTPPTVSSSSCSFSHGVSTNNLTSSFSSSRKIEPLAYSLEGNDVGVCFGGSSCSVCPKNIDPSVSTHRSNVTCSSSSFRKAKPLAYSLEGDDEGVCFRGTSCSVCPKNIDSSVSTHGSNATCSWSSFRKAKPLAYSLEGNDEGVCFGGTSCSVCPKNIDSSVSTHGNNATCSSSSFTKAKPLAYSPEGTDEGVCFGETSHSDCPKNVSTSVSTHGNNATCSWSLFRKTEPLAYSLQSDDENVCFKGTKCSVCPKTFASSVSTHGKSNFYSSSLQTTELPFFSSRDASPCSICDTKVAPPASPPESTGPWANYLDDMKTVTSSYGGTLCPKHAASSASHLGRTDPCSPSLEIRDFSTSSSSGDVSRHCTYKRHISPSASGASSLEQTALFSSSLFDSCSCTLPSKNISSAFSSPGKSCSCSRYTSTSDPYALSTEKTYTSELCPIRTYLYLFRSMKYEP
ncbi:serine-rich adhesin for platelets-like [Pleurodeles waltl]|uniref:serine-rich adhesin for platelets-like n=1 Tax=Pleurodeles waltl TaxID=8319 RepID=UPI0037099A05